MFSRFCCGRIPLVLILLVSSWQIAVASDPILAWNATLRQAIQSNTTQANPGWSTRSMALTNGALYDITMSFGRTHTPFLYNHPAVAGASREAAYAQAAYETILHAYPDQQAILDVALANALAAVPNGQGKTDGIALGSTVGQAYIAWRVNDNSDVNVPYVPVGGPGRWTPDPFNPGQQAWGPGWGMVRPYTLTSSNQFSVPGPPTLDSQAYTDAYVQVMQKGVATGSTRTADETAIGLFWAYDRVNMGPPPVLFSRNVEEIALQAGNTLEENARLFAMASMAMADASVAAWDVKFVYDYWRPVTAIQQADTDGNPNTLGDPTWRPLGAPGNDPNAITDNFTPPFPAYVSGHATFGGAVFEVLRDFYGTDMQNFVLTSQEMPIGQESRSFVSFGQAEYENAISRVYLGIHWEFDAIDGINLGNDIADWVTGNYFQAVPEPSSSLMVIALAVAGGLRRRR
jgi:PAP2 superfamily/PEP-CTERM motif